MQVYVVMHKDRHIDTEPTVFSNPQIAVKHARKTAKDYCRFGEDYKEERVEGWLFYARYSCEDDCIWVIEKELQES